MPWRTVSHVLAVCGCPATTPTLGHPSSAWKVDISLTYLAEKYRGPKAGTQDPLTELLGRGLPSANQGSSSGSLAATLWLLPGSRVRGAFPRGARVPRGRVHLPHGTCPLCATGIVQGRQGKGPSLILEFVPSSHLSNKCIPCLVSGNLPHDARGAPGVL